MVGCGVYEISDKDEQALDVYAGVPYFYQKQAMQVQCVWDVTTRREVLHNIEAILYTLPAAICRSARAGMMTFISASFRCAKL